MSGKNLLVSIAASVFGIGFLTAAASAETVSVKGAQRTAIHQIGTIGENCASGPYPTITRAIATNGTVTSKKSSTKMSSGVCKGKTIKTVLIIYKANGGFRGRDSVSLAWKFRPHSNTSVVRSRTKTITVNVR